MPHPTPWQLQCGLKFHLKLVQAWDVAIFVFILTLHYTCYFSVALKPVTKREYHPLSFLFLITTQHQFFNSHRDWWGCCLFRVSLCSPTLCSSIFLKRIQSFSLLEGISRMTLVALNTSIQFASGIQTLYACYLFLKKCFIILFILISLFVSLCQSLSSRINRSRSVNGAAWKPLSSAILTWKQNWLWTIKISIIAWNVISSSHWYLHIIIYVIKLIIKLVRK